MITAQFLAEWTLRSSLLIGAGALLLWAFRIHNPSIRLAAWTAVLVSSLVIPALRVALPPMPMSLVRWSVPAPPVAASPVEVAASIEPAPGAASPIVITPTDVAAPTSHPQSEVTSSADRSGWLFGAVTVYVLGAGALFLRLLAGLGLSLRLRRDVSATGQVIDGIDVRESGRISAPVTLGILRPVIVLPSDWREWDPPTLAAVLAHERSHVRRRDPAVQLFSLIHRAVLWHNPLSWFLHERIARTAEEASDDAALAVTGDRATYAEVLLRFMQRGVRRGIAFSVPMARHGRPARRIDRILDGAPIARGVSAWSVAVILTLGSPIVYIVATAQAQPAFEAADIHVSPPVVGAVGSPLAFAREVPIDGGLLPDGRYEVRRANLVSLIAAAYGVEPDQVVGGPSWLEWSRFDVTAHAPTNARADAVPQMLQSLLTDRFGLLVRKDTTPVSAYVLSLGAGAHRLKVAGGSDESGCQVSDGNDGLSCRNTTMDALAARLAAAPGTRFQVLNSTRLAGSWDFEISYPRPGGQRGVFGIPQPGDTDRGIFDAVDQQLGLKLEVRDVPQPVLVVERAHEPSTAPPAGAGRVASTAMKFEVATIKPCKSGTGVPTRPPSGFLLNTGCAPLETHVRTAWGFNNGPGSPMDPMEGPDWIDSTYFEITAKSPIAIGGPRDPNYLAMLRNLLVERFQMKTHWEDRPRDARVLVADKPKLKPADPSTRTRCTRPLTGNLGSRTPTVLTCQNVTMAQFAEVVGSRGGRFYATVDETGLAGGWNLRVSWMTPGAAGLLRPAENTPDAGAALAASEPIGIVSSLEQAIEEQLWLKLEVRKRPTPILIIEHVDENPTEN